MLSTLWRLLRAAQPDTASKNTNETSTRRFACEPLEDRVLLSTYYTTPASESFHGSGCCCPGCGGGGAVSDLVTTTPSASFSATGYQWNQSAPGARVDITYSFHTNFLNGSLKGISPTVAQQAIREALGLWATYAPLNFIEVADAGPDPALQQEYDPTGMPMIRFGARAQDGPFNVLAYAYYPHNSSGLAGDVIFDSTENWATHPTAVHNTIDILEVAVHEIGHALGMGHEGTNQAIMNASYGRRFNGLGTSFLFQDDIQGIQAIYGSGTGSAPPVAPPAPLEPQLVTGDINGDGYDDYVITEGSGQSPLVKVISGRTRNQLASFFAYEPGFRGGVNLAVEDLNGDGYDDIITAAGAGGGPHVRVFSGRNYSVLADFFAYDPGFRGGVELETGDFNGDGLNDLITVAGAGGGPHVQVFSGGNFAQLASFFAYDPGFTGGVNLATGDVNGDGLDDIITAAKAGGGPHVRAFSGGSLAVLTDIFAYDTAFLGGVELAVDDVNGDGLDDIITAPGVNGASHIRVFRGGSFTDLASFFAYDPAFTGGVSLATGDINRDGRADIITGAGAGGGPHIRAFSGAGFSAIASYFGFDPSFTGGVSVATGDMNRDGWDDIVNFGGPNQITAVNALSGRTYALLASFAPFSSLVGTPSLPHADSGGAPGQATNWLSWLALPSPSEGVVLDSDHDHEDHDHDHGWLEPHAFYYSPPAWHTNESHCTHEESHESDPDAYFEWGDGLL